MASWVNALCDVGGSFSSEEMNGMMEAFDPEKDGPLFAQLDVGNEKRVINFFRSILGRSQKREKNPDDITRQMVRANSPLLDELPVIFDLKDFLLTPPQDPFPLSPEAFAYVRQYKVDGFFSCGSQERHCVRLSHHVLHVLSPPPHGTDEFSYIPLWNAIMHDTLAIFMLESFHFNRNTNQNTYTLAQLPDYVAYVASSFALWRGEEKGPATEGDPRQELVDKLVWVYRSIPYLMAYHARGTKVSVTALTSLSATTVHAFDLLSLDLEVAEERIRAMLILFNVSRLLMKLSNICKVTQEMSDVCVVQEADHVTGKSVVLKGYYVIKGYRDYDRAVQVYETYQLLKDVPNAEQCKTAERPRKRKREETSLIMLPRCSQMARAWPEAQELVTALVHVTNALYQAHKKHKLMHRDVTWRNVGLDESCGQFILFDWDEACKSPCRQAHPLCAVAHAPEMATGSHTTAVDVWGLGHLVRTATTGVEKPQELLDLAAQCLADDPLQRPSIEECLARLQTMLS